LTVFLASFVVLGRLTRILGIDQCSEAFWMSRTIDEIRDCRWMHIHATNIYKAHYFEAQNMDGVGIVLLAYRYKGSGCATSFRRSDYTLEEAQATADWLNEFVKRWHVYLK
jgi:hypothetical protein